jgi:hypothetical protein
MKRSNILAAALMAVVLGSDGTEAGAQDTARVELSRWILPGSDVENYVRALQTLGMVRRYPWSARSFSGHELRRLTVDSTAHPWSAHPSLAGSPRRFGGLSVDVAPLKGTTWYNTALPYGMNDGAVWVGRGLTVAGSAGVSATWGPVELTLAPEVFWAQNRAFDLLPTGDSTRPFADPLWPTDVDRPQRFGNESYGRADAGQSGIRVDLAGLALGVSNVHQAWGPMTEFPLIMGTNAPGFAHAFLGTSRPVNIGIGRVHGRVIYGRLEQSEFSPVATLNPSRFGSGMVAVFEPRFLPGLELGASRFFHVVWPDSGLESRYFTHIFQSFLKQRIGEVFAPFPGDPNSSTDNQLASVFARWVLPGGGFELYGEFGREDHNRDPRDLMLEPDNNAAYGLGARKAWNRDGCLLVARAEVVNLATSVLGRHRAQHAWYRHTFTQQGHTNHGQLIAAPGIVGSGAGATAALEQYTPLGLRRVAWTRIQQDAQTAGQAPVALHVLTVEQRASLSHRVQWSVGTELTYRDEQGTHDFGGRLVLAISLNP